ncbi:MAG: PAS domain S-box protein [Tabrizicola sp.]|uniref:methyl-accepting chemotaxis protein n=1 Tax=Tabrizicola sp. TaxID=2005166 RepID=UPI002ABC916F|nr:PAS domain S-box protein [Tabrizicola sp.]MDZ4088657.1 PAS domain S-box protein [Tabrizicola sp.]
MLSFLRKSHPAACLSGADALAAALTRTHAIIWFNLDGTIRDANDLFLATTGYTRDEIIGAHHRIFMPPGSADRPEYQHFWDRLRAGHSLSQTVERRSKTGSPLWLAASYTALMGPDGTIDGFVKYATDVTRRTDETLEAEGIRTAIERSQAVIEFDTNGTILTANQSFLAAMGYSLADLRGKHHSMFLIDTTADDPDYRAFWESLRAGGFHTGEYCRRSKSGGRVWLQATYNAILGADGKVAKVIKFATDISQTKRAALETAGRIAAIDRAQAVIEFDPTGRILTANQNFLAVVGYRLEEIVGQHHSLFMPPGEADLPAYHALWASLRAGKLISSEFQRRSKAGTDVWILASYNPVFDAEGRVEKVVKYATDVTARKLGTETIALALDRLASGDLGYRIDTPLVGELETVRTNLNATFDRLADTLHNVSQNARSVQHECSSLSKSAIDLSSRTEKQANSLAQASGALSQMSRSTTQTSEQTAEASRLASSARHSAEASSVVVMDAVQAMSRIADGSDQISRIIGVIDEIAFQTNLLALNAGVEAARAGDAGRGFAVVASEVRALALKSSTAAKEIAMLIGQSVTEVKTGETLVNRAGEAIGEIRSAITEIHERMVEITQATTDQTGRLKDLSKTVTDLDQATQRNAAMFEETAAATAEMTRAADDLVGCIADFRLRPETHASLELRQAS